MWVVLCCVVLCCDAVEAERCYGGWSVDLVCFLRL